MSQNVQSVTVSIDKSGQEMRKISKYKLHNLSDDTLQLHKLFSYNCLSRAAQRANARDKLDTLAIYSNILQNELTDSLHSATIAKQVKD